VHDHDPLLLVAARFVDQPIHIIGVTREHNDRTGLTQRRCRHNGIDGTSVSRQASCTKELTSASCEFGIHRYDHDSGQHTVDRRITRSTPKDFGQRDRADDSGSNT
jgi:hypothetical protein